MPRRTKHTLITAEVLGFFLIIIAVLGLTTGRRVFIVASMVLFGLIIAVSFLFAVFAYMAWKENKRPAKAGKRK